jgi:hypothetical protein
MLPVERAVDWIKRHHLRGEGIAVSSQECVPYPEVSGYLIPSLLEAGEQDLTLDLGRWLISVQRHDGGFAGPSTEREGDESYLFDTGQVLRGFVALVDLMPEVRQPLIRAADFLVHGGEEDGLVAPRRDSKWGERYGDHISTAVHLYALPPLAEAARRFGRQDYSDAVTRTLDAYLCRPGLLEFRFLTHFYGYVLDALIDLGRSDLAREGLLPILRAQAPDGSIPGVPGAHWTCSPGALQMAIVGYRLGFNGFADGALRFVERLQMPSGGFLGSYGPGAAYAHDSELSWASKYFLDAVQWSLRARTLTDGRLPAGVRRPHRWRQQALARHLVAEGVACTQRGDLRTARQALLRAVTLDPRWLTRRQVVGILVQSFIAKAPGKLSRT